MWLVSGLRLLRVLRLRMCLVGFLGGFSLFCWVGRRRHVWGFRRTRGWGGKGFGQVLGWIGGLVLVGKMVEGEEGF